MTHRWLHRKTRYHFIYAWNERKVKAKNFPSRNPFFVFELMSSRFRGRKPARHVEKNCLTVGNRNVQFSHFPFIIKATAKIPKATGDKWMTSLHYIFGWKVFNDITCPHQWLKMFLMVFPFHFDLLSVFFFFSGTKWKNPRNLFILADHWLSAKINRNWTSRSEREKKQQFWTKIEVAVSCWRERKFPLNFEHGALHAWWKSSSSGAFWKSCL